MMTSAADRADAVCAEIEEMAGIGHFWEPLHEMDRVTIEPLPDLENFLPLWRALIASQAAGERCRDSDTKKDRWVGEVVQQLEGSDGLAQIARSTRRADDLRAWCKSLVDAGDWAAALAAFEEAALLIADHGGSRGEFLDGAAVAAQGIGCEDSAIRFEWAWRAGPGFPRLRRWLGSAPTKVTLAEHVTRAIDACPKPAARQRALLYVLDGDFARAAALLAAAPSLGWSDGEHPGHLLFPLFARFLSRERNQIAFRNVPSLGTDLDVEDLTVLKINAGPSMPAAPEIEELLMRAGIETIMETDTATVLGAMKSAAENRIASVTGQKRRRQYSHAAELVATCVACDGTNEGARWAAALKAEYRRFFALRDELDRALGAA